MRAKISPGIVLCALITATPGLVQAEDEANDRPWTNKAEFSFVTTGGNSQTTTVSFANEFIYNWAASNLTVTASALKSDTTTRSVANLNGSLDINEITEATAEMYTLGGKFIRNIREGFYWYVAGGWERNRFAGIENRYNPGAGVGYRIFKTDKHELTSEFGANYTSESFVAGTIPTSASYAGARGFLGYKRALSETAEFSSTLELLQNLDVTQDLRGIWISSVTASLNARLALKVSYSVFYDKQPVEQVLEAVGFDPVIYRFDTTDTILSASLVANF